MDRSRHGVDFLLAPCATPLNRVQGRKTPPGKIGQHSVLFEGETPIPFRTKFPRRWAGPCPARPRGPDRRQKLGSIPSSLDCTLLWSPPSSGRPADSGRSPIAGGGDRPRPAPILPKSDRCSRHSAPPVGEASRLRRMPGSGFCRLDPGSRRSRSCGRVSTEPLPAEVRSCPAGGPVVFPLYASGLASPTVSDLVRSQKPATPVSTGYSTSHWSNMLTKQSEGKPRARR